MLHGCSVESVQSPNVGGVSSHTPVKLHPPDLVFISMTRLVGVTFPNVMLSSCHQERGMSCQRVRHCEAQQLLN